MADVTYAAQTGAAVALAAATAKTILGVKSGASFGIQVVQFKVAFDGVTASAVPVLCELCYATFATNAPGTASTSVTPVQHAGRALTHGVTAARAWSSEPTVLTAIDEWLLTPNGGLLDEWISLGAEPDTALGEGLALRCTAPAIVNVRATMRYQRV